MLVGDLHRRVGGAEKQEKEQGKNMNNSSRMNVCIHLVQQTSTSVWRMPMIGCMGTVACICRCYITQKNGTRIARSMRK